MTRRAQLLVSAVFIAVMVMPGLFLVAGSRPENLENKTVAPFPELSPASLVDEKEYAAIGDFLTDRLPYRDKGIRAEARLNNLISLGDPVDPSNHREKDGWYYLGDELVDTCVGPPPAYFLERGDQVAAELAEADIPFRFFVAPDKVSIYPDNLPLTGLAGALNLSGGDAPGCNALWDRAMVDAAPSAPWLDPLADDLRADLDSSDEPLYFKADTHWTDAGALNMVEAVVRSLAPELWDPAEIERTADDVNVGDVSRLMLDPQTESMPGYVVNRPGISTEYDPSKWNGPPAADIFRTTSTQSAVIPGTTLLIGDSFGSRAMDLLGPYFEELIFVKRAYVMEHGLDVLDRRPTAVLVELVQRDMGYGSYPELLDSIEEYLARNP